MDRSETHAEQKKPDNKNTSARKFGNRKDRCVVMEIRPMVAWGEGIGNDLQGEQGCLLDGRKVLYFDMIWVILVYALVKSHCNT